MKLKQGVEYFRDDGSRAYEGFSAVLCRQHCPRPVCTQPAGDVLQVSQRASWLLE